jgi:hypothetical protein
MPQVRAADVLARFDKNKLNRLDALKPKRRKSTVMGVLGVMGAVAIKRSETSSEGNEDVSPLVFELWSFALQPIERCADPWVGRTLPPLQ